MDNKIYENGNMKLEEIFFIENPNSKYNLAENIHDNFGIYKRLDARQDFVVAHGIKKTEDDKELTWSWGHYDFNSLSESMKYLNDFFN